MRVRLIRERAAGRWSLGLELERRRPAPAPAPVRRPDAERSPWWLPVARRAVEGDRLTYVRPSRMKGPDWDRGAEWEEPTSLDFEQATITARRYFAHVFLADDVPVPPEVVVHNLEYLWAELRRGLAAERYVVDPRDPQGVTFDRDPFAALVSVSARLKVWPAVPGFNAPGPWEDEHPSAAAARALRGLAAVDRRGGK